MPHRLKLVATILLVCCCIVASAQDYSDAADDAPQPLKVWLPAPLISDEAGSAYQLLSSHAADFSSNNAINVQFRIKSSGEIGGIMSTIRAGKEVAPTALPDLTLIRRQDLTPAQAAEYLQSLDTLFSSSVLNDLANGIEFGQIPLEDKHALYGFPYLFDLLIGVQSQPVITSGPLLSFADVLANESSFLFPAARSHSMNSTFFVQYLAAGGSLPSEGEMAINEEALHTVLKFYEALVSNGQVSTEVLTYQSPSAYLNDFINDDGTRLAIVSVSDYLNLIQQESADLAATDIPTADANSFSVLDGWLWVLVTPDRNRQALAARFIEWMMEPEFHAAIAHTLHHLPSQPAVLPESLPPAADTDLFARLLAVSVPPLPEAERGVAPRLMHEALKQVIHAETSADLATQAAISQLAER